MIGPRLARARRLLAFVVLGLIFICIPLAPFALGGSQAAADLFFCFVIAWVLRAPGSAPVWLIVPLALLADFLLSRPVGLGALALLAASEIARRQGGYFRDVTFIFQWFVVCVGFNLLLLAQVVLLKLVFLPVPGLDALVRISIATGITYPVISAFLVRGLGLGRQRVDLTRTVGGRFA